MTKRARLAAGLTAGLVIVVGVGVAGVSSWPRQKVRRSYFDGVGARASVDVATGTAAEETRARSAGRSAAPPKFRVGGDEPVRLTAVIGQARPITLDELPPALRAVVDQVAAGRTVTGLKVREDQWRNQIRTKLGFEADGMKHDIKVDAQARIVSAEVGFKVEELPAVIRNAIAADRPRAVIVSAERQWHDDEPTYFDVKLRDGEREWEFHVLEDGRISERNKRR